MYGAHLLIKLVAYHIRIILSKEIIADSAPCVVDADLNSAFECISPVHQPHITIRTGGANGSCCCQCINVT